MQNNYILTCQNLNIYKEGTPEPGKYSYLAGDRKINHIRIIVITCFENHNVETIKSKFQISIILSLNFY